jgi:hypothetical protein
LAARGWRRLCSAAGDVLMLTSMRERRRAGGAARAAQQDERSREACELLRKAWRAGDGAAAHEALRDWHVEVPDSFWPQRRGQRASQEGCERTRLRRLGTARARRAGCGSSRWRCGDQARTSGGITMPSS